MSFLKSQPAATPTPSSSTQPSAAPTMPVAPAAPSSTDTPWMDWMNGHLGELEVTGDKATDFDKLVFSHTDYGSLDGTMVAGCAATACAALELTGYKSPHNAAAISFKTYGTACDLKPGCVVVFQWDGGGHHVTFCDRVMSDGTVNCLGGNQSHKLQVSNYGKSHIIATRWPEKS